MREIKEAECWLKSAKMLFDESSTNREKYTVVVAQCIHSIIRANDALSMHFLGRCAMRHDDAPRLFLELICENKIESKYAILRDVITRSVQLKSKVDYKGLEMSKTDAKRWITKAENFYKAAIDSLD